MIIKYTVPHNDSYTLTLTAKCSIFIFFVKCSLSKESEDHEKYPKWKKHVEQFPEGTCLQTVSDFFLWLKYNYSPPEEHHGCEGFGRMLLHSAPWCSSLTLGPIWRCLVGCWGWGSCKRQKHWAKGTPRRGEGTIILNSCLGDWAQKLPGGR